eukprot:3386942-Rhodomonas_salina.1
MPNADCTAQSTRSQKLTELSFARVLSSSCVTQLSKSCCCCMCACRASSEDEEKKRDDDGAVKGGGEGGGRMKGRRKNQHAGKVNTHGKLSGSRGPAWMRNSSLQLSKFSNVFTTLTSKTSTQQSAPR